MRRAMSFQPFAGISAGLVALRPRSSLPSLDDLFALSAGAVRLGRRATEEEPVLCNPAGRRGCDMPVKCRTAPTASAHSGVRCPELPLCIGPMRLLGRGYASRVTQISD